MSNQYKHMLYIINPIDETANHIVIDPGNVRHSPVVIVNDKVYYYVPEHVTDFPPGEYINYDRAIWSE